MRLCTYGFEQYNKLLLISYYQTNQYKLIIIHFTSRLFISIIFWLKRHRTLYKFIIALRSSSCANTSVLRVLIVVDNTKKLFVQQQSVKLVFAWFLDFETMKFLVEQEENSFFFNGKLISLDD